VIGDAPDIYTHTGLARTAGSNAPLRLIASCPLSEPYCGAIFFFLSAKKLQVRHRVGGERLATPPTAISPRSSLARVNPEKPNSCAVSCSTHQHELIAPVETSPLAAGYVQNPTD
jgi:hypothetical protein